MARMLVMMKQKCRQPLHQASMISSLIPLNLTPLQMYHSAGCQKETMPTHRTTFLKSHTLQWVQCQAETVHQFPSHGLAGSPWHEPMHFWETSAHPLFSGELHGPSPLVKQGQHLYRHSLLNPSYRWLIVPWISLTRWWQVSLPSTRPNCQGPRHMTRRRTKRKTSWRSGTWTSPRSNPPRGHHLWCRQSLHCLPIWDTACKLLVHHPRYTGVNWNTVPVSRSTHHASVPQCPDSSIFPSSRSGRWHLLSWQLGTPKPRTISWMLRLQSLASRGLHPHTI